MTTPRIAEINYDAITTNYIEFLRNQEEFKDLDFDASVIRRIIGLLAYDLHYAAFYANAAHKEHFLDSAVLRSSVVSHAKRRGYVPRSQTASTALVDVRIQNGSVILNEFLQLPKGTIFSGSTRDRSKTYTFTTTKSYQVFADSTDLTFENVELVQGSYSSTDYVIDDYYFKRGIELPFDTIDTRYLEVYVQDGVDSTVFELYSNAEGRLTTSDERVYWLEEGPDGKFLITFGDGVIGRMPNRGQVVKILYITTSGGEANNVQEFSFSSSTSIFQNFLTTSFSSVIVSPLTSSGGGDGPESTEDIRFRAERYRGDGTNALRIQDYEEVISKQFPEFAAIRIWDATYLDDPAGQIGKIFISAIPKNSLYLTTSRKNAILNEIQSTIAGVNKCFEFVDPDYIFPRIVVRVERTGKPSKYEDSVIRDLIKDLLVKYGESEFRSFGSRLEPSNIVREIHDLDSSIDNVILDISLEYQVIPTLNSTLGYVGSIDNEIFSGTVISNSFEVAAGEVYLKDDGAGNLGTYLTSTNAAQNLNAGKIDYATGKFEIFPLTVIKGNRNSGKIELKASAKNKNITTKEGRVLRIERDYVSVTFSNNSMTQLKYNR